MAVMGDAHNIEAMVRQVSQTHFNIKICLGRLLHTELLFWNNRHILLISQLMSTFWDVKYITRFFWRPKPHSYHMSKSLWLLLEESKLILMKYIGFIAKFEYTRKYRYYILQFNIHFSKLSLKKLFFNIRWECIITISYMDLNPDGARNMRQSAESPSPSPEQLHPRDIFKPDRFNR